jgi:hypothetical protein
VAQGTKENQGHLSEQEYRSLVRDLAAGVVRRVEPDELAVFDETAAEYFEDPQTVLDPRHKDETVGFGVDVELITPLVLAVAGPVVEYLAGVFVEAAGEGVRPRLVRRLRRLLRIEDPDEPASEEPSPLTAEQLQQVRAVAFARARDVGLEEDRARLLADAVTGGLTVG